MAKLKSQHRLRKQLANSDNQFVAGAYFAGMYDFGDAEAFLILSGGDVRKRVVSRGEDFRSRHLQVRDVDGVPHTVLRCRKKYIASLLKCKLATQAYSLLSQLLADVDIKAFFYDLWLQNHNHMAGKARRRERLEFKAVGRRRDPDAGIIGHITTGMSGAEAARSYGTL